MKALILVRLLLGQATDPCAYQRSALEYDERNLARYPNMDFYQKLVADKKAQLDACRVAVEQNKRAKGAALAAQKETTQRNREQAIAQARQRAEDEAEEATEARHREELARVPAFAGPALSLMLCHNAKVRAAAKSEILTEWRYAREGGGVVDMSALHDLQDELADVDASNRWVKSQLKRVKARPMSCSTELIRRLAACVNALASERAIPTTCSEPRVVDTLSLYPAVADDHFVAIDSMPWFPEAPERERIRDVRGHGPHPPGSQMGR